MASDLIAINKHAKKALVKSKDLLEITKALINNNIIEFEHKYTTWRDVETNLVWEIKSSENYEKIYSYDEALQYVNVLNQSKFGGFSNWEIPTIDDLETLYTNVISNNLYIKKQLSKNSDWAYWSSTNISENQNVVFYYNYGEKRREFHKFKCSVRCVFKGVRHE